MTEAKKPEVGDTWYRYEDRRHAVVNEFDDVVGTYVKVYLTTLTVTKVTPKGVWVSLGQICAPRFVLLSANKRYAAPTKEEALASLKARKARQISILEGQLGHARDAVRLADQELAKLRPPGEPVAVAVEPLRLAEPAFA